MRKSILLLIAAIWGWAIPLSAQSGDVSDAEADSAAVSEPLPTESAWLSMTPEQIDELRFKLTKKVVRGVVRSQADGNVLVGAGVVFNSDTLRTDADGAFSLVVPYEQQKVVLIVFPEEQGAESSDLATQMGEFDVKNLDIYLATSWKWSEMLWVALISICLVFFVLVLLVGVMKLFGCAFARKPQQAPAASKPVVQGQLHEEEIAAIAVALKLYKGALHDRESEVLTIMNIKRAYSPWNSKIHGLTQMPDRK